MIRRIRIRALEEQAFPYYLGSELINKYFSFVSRNYDFTILPLIKEEFQNNFDIEIWKKYMDGSSPTAVIHTLDEYWNRSIFNQSMIDICENCDIVFGHQIPITKSQTKFTPLFFRSLIQPINKFDDNQLYYKYKDICFWGAGATDSLFEDLDQNKLPLRERNYRSFVIDKIFEISKNELSKIDIRDIYYWNLSSQDRQIKSLEYAQALKESKLGLSLYGYGFNSFRNADIFSVGCTLLSPQIYNHILLPEMDKWYNNELGFFFLDDCSDIDKTIRIALENNLERQKRGYNGYIYFKKYGTNAGIIETIYNRLLRYLRK